MENLLKYINEAFIIEELNAIDSEIICESLNCKVLKEVAAQLVSYNKADQEIINKRKKEAEEENYRYWGPDKSRLPLFNKVFADKFQIAWDKITDSDVTVIDATSWEKSTPHNSSEIRKVINTKKNSMLIVQNPETKEYEFLIYSGGRFIVLSKTLKRNYDYKNVGEDWSGLNQKQKIEMCQGKTLYYIDNVTERARDVSDLRDKRREEKRGMINLDPYSLKRIAEDNRERYKKIVAKMKSMNVNNDALLDKCNKIIKNITDLSITVAKDPISNADIYSGITSLMPFIYDKKEYVPSNRYSKSGYYKGVDGLLPLILQYTQSLKFSMQNGSDYSLKSVEEYKNKINNTLQKIESIASKYNINLD